MAIEKILFTTKFRELSFNSLQSLFELKNTGLKEIILCHVISRDDVGYVPFGGYLKEEEERLREEARIRFEDWQKSIRDQGINSKIVIAVGNPVPKILHVAEDEKADLIVVGRKKRAEIEHPFAGSNTLQIISRSKIPALVSKYMVQYKSNEDMITKINENIFERPMLVTNWTEPCKRALAFLLSLKGVVKKADVFHNIDVRISKKHRKDELRVLEDDCRHRLDGYCGQLSHAGIKCESHLGAGIIVDEILRISRERQASMIIISTTGKDRLYELFHRSVSHQVAKTSELPTLLVP